MRLSINHSYLLKKILTAGVPTARRIEPHGKTIYISIPHHREIKPSGVVEHGEITVDFGVIFGEHEKGNLAS